MPRQQYPNHPAPDLFLPSLCGRSARGEGGAGRRCENIKNLELGSSETQEAGHGHENTLQNPRLTPRFWGTFTPGPMQNGKLFTRSQNELGNFFTRNENELGNFFTQNRELPVPSLHK